MEQKEGWERKLLEKLATDALVEQRRRRRWGIFFKLIAVFYFGALLITSFGIGPTTAAVEAGPHVAVVKLEGVIASDSDASADKVVTGLRAAFEASKSTAVMLKINSPGGSPVQSGLINDEIKRLRAKYPAKPIYAVVDEICASGGYYVAVAADKIYVNKASLIGSIGVLMNGFGFTEAMKKLGIERRLITAGENKGFLDPFSEPNPYQVEFAKQLAEQIHKQFIDVVKEGRGERLKNDPQIFSGLIWNGEAGVALGLADGFGSVGSIAREEFKSDTVIDYSETDSFAERFAKKVGVEFGRGITAGFLGSAPASNFR